MGGNKEDGSHTPKENRRPLPVIKEDDIDDDKTNVKDTLVVSPDFAGGRRRSSSETVSALARLKETTARLKLTTRRASYIAWQAQCLEKPYFPPKEELEKCKHGKLTAERMKRMDDAIDWLKNELQEMKVHDQSLARQFLVLRHDIQQLKLVKSCEAHQEMLDDVHSEIEDLEAMADVLDLPTISINDNPLKHLGITRMNITRRRFSIF